MAKYVIGIFSFVIIVALAGFFSQTFLTAENNVQGAFSWSSKKAVQTGGGITVQKTTNQRLAPQQKKATTGLIVKNKMSFTTTPMPGIIHLQGIPISADTLKNKGIRLENGKLLTPGGKDVQIKDVEMRRKPIKLTFNNK